MSFVLSNLRMNNLSNDIVSIIKQLVNDVVLSLITFNSKARDFELNSYLKNKSE